MVGKTVQTSSPNLIKIQKYLRAFEFDSLFKELGWDNPGDKPLTVSADGHEYVLRPLVEKRQVKVFLCSPDAAGHVPANSTLLKIEREVTRLGAFEHVIIYTDAARTQQAWQWVLRSEKRTRNRVKRYYQGQSGEALALRLRQLNISLEEELSLGTGDVTKKLKNAFDTEKVTKKFYDLFKKQHADFLKLIEGIDDPAAREWYASLLLNRLMFVYFIQKKNWLDGDPDYLVHKLELSQQTNGVDTFHTFYRYFLRVLFHDGLGKRERSPELERLLGRVPYLNGGLFEVHKIEQDNPDINIPDSAFVKLFTFFNSYDWHLDDRPLRKDNEINPDVLGYIFEKYINQKQMGAYYTKEDITEYISKNTLIPFLLEAAEQKCLIAFRAEGPVWALLRDDPDTYIYDAMKKGVELKLPADIEAGRHDVSLREGWNRPAPQAYALPTETWREVVARHARYQEVHDLLAAGKVTSVNDLITYNLDIHRFAMNVITYCGGSDLIKALYDSISQVTVLDPTCGSGAFLFAALNILEDLYEACLDRMQDMIAASDAYDATLPASRRHRHNDIEHFRSILNNADAHHAGRTYFIYKSIIIHNLYGVDIMEEATEICKLRLFLKLASQIKTYEQIEPLPDIDFNIRAGNTLVGFASLEETQKALQGKNVGNGAVQNQMIFDDRLEKIERRAKDIEQAFIHFRNLQTELELKPEVLAGAKQQMRNLLGSLRTELDGYLATEYGIERGDYKGKEAEYQTKFLDWQQHHQPFHWWVEFYGILDQGGFDVIIGNPPYVEYKNVKEYKLLQGKYRSEDAKNLYAFSMERSSLLLNTHSNFGMIVPAALLGLDEVASLRDLLLQRFNDNWFSTFAIRPSKLFDGVDQRLCIHIAISSFPPDKRKIYTTTYHHWNTDERAALFHKIHYQRSTIYPMLKRIPQLGTREAVSILERLNDRQKKLVMHYYADKAHGFLMHYHRSPRYWIRSMDFEQYFKSATRERSIHHFRDLHLTDVLKGKSIGAVINSSLFFFWFLSIGNGRNITGADVEMFPIGDLPDETCRKLADLFDKLMDDYKRNSIIRIRKDCELQEFRPSKSKPIIDEIDRVLAQHYGFTDEELDFIINYDIKYRMGRDGADSDGEEEE